MIKLSLSTDRERFFSLKRRSSRRNGRGRAFGVCRTAVAMSLLQKKSTTILNFTRSISNIGYVGNLAESCRGCAKLPQRSNFCDELTGLISREAAQTSGERQVVLCLSFKEPLGPSTVPCDLMSEEACLFQKIPEDSQKYEGVPRRPESSRRTTVAKTSFSRKRISGRRDAPSPRSTLATTLYLTQFGVRGETATTKTFG